MFGIFKRNKIFCVTDPISANTLVSGVYTPTLTNVTNISGNVAYSCTYVRINNIVTVTGKVGITGTTTGLQELGISLPIVSDFTLDEDCCGVGADSTSNEDACTIKADTTSNIALLSQTHANASSHAHYFTFTYKIK